MQINKGKIFGVGLPKTGTMSLYLAVKNLGFNSIHYPIESVIPRLHKSDYTCFEKYDAYFNCGEWHFAAIDRMFPDSKFIYTWRDYEEWIVSVRKHFHRYDIPEKHTDPYSNRLEIFGTVVFNESVMETIYWAHKYAVEKYFSNKGNILKLNVTEQDAYQKLCEFLGVPVINEKFPHENKYIES